MCQPGWRRLRQGDRQRCVSRSAELAVFYAQIRCYAHKNPLSATLMVADNISLDVGPRRE